MTGHSHVWRSQRGVTMIELIAVLIIVGVLGAIASARYFDRSTFDADAFANQARSMLRFGQKLAVAQNRPVYARIDTGSVALCFEADCKAASRIIAPSGTNSGSARTLQLCDQSTTWLCEGLPNGLTQAVSGSAASFAFDALGKPYAANADGTLGDFEPVVVEITGDGVERTVTVEPETGYVY